MEPPEAMRNPSSATRAAISLALPIALLAGGCTRAVNVTTTRQTPSAASVPFRTDVNDALGKAQLRLAEVRVDRSPGGPLRAQVDVSNETSRVKRFSYKFEWLDAAGVLIYSTQSTWIPASVPPGGIATIRSVAPTDAAADFRLQVLRSQ